jgi:hypothetical protein
VYIFTTIVAPLLYKAIPPTPRSNYCCRVGYSRVDCGKVDYGMVGCSTVGCGTVDYGRVCYY